MMEILNIIETYYIIYYLLVNILLIQINGVIKLLLNYIAFHGKQFEIIL